MNAPRPSASEPPEPSTRPLQGWHCLHAFYAFDRSALQSLDDQTRRAGMDRLRAAVDPRAEHAPQRIQLSIVSGHRADFGLMMMDPDPLRIDSLHQRVLDGPLGATLKPTYSFVSLSEVSEYVMTAEQYAERLVRDGEQPGSPSLEAKLNSYRQRLPMMNRERLTPDFPDWPVTCFYPMNKMRQPHENWFMLPASRRQQLMSEHARSGMKFMGRVKQLITVAVGLDDWEWGVTLWATNPQYLKEIVYAMRFDEASARYAEFGPFLTSYPTTCDRMLEHCRIGTAGG